MTPLSIQDLWSHLGGTTVEFATQDDRGIESIFRGTIGAAALECLSDATPDAKHGARSALYVM